MSIKLDYKPVVVLTDYMYDSIQPFQDVLIVITLVMKIVARLRRSSWLAGLRSLSRRRRRNNAIIDLTISSVCENKPIPLNDLVNIHITFCFQGPLLFHQLLIITFTIILSFILVLTLPTILFR